MDTKTEIFTIKYGTGFDGLMKGIYHAITRLKHEAFVEDKDLTIVIPTLIHKMLAMDVNNPMKHQMDSAGRLKNIMGVKVQLGYEPGVVVVFWDNYEYYSKHKPIRITVEMNKKTDDEVKCDSGMCDGTLEHCNCKKD